jgi:predicted Zn finger-like uncharacterized protein
MRIVCPSCSVVYEVPDSLIAAGQVARCARCGGEWMPVRAAEVATEPVAPSTGKPPPSASDAATASRAFRGPAGGYAGDKSSVSEAPLPRSSAMDRLAAPPARPPSRLRLRLAWLASLALLACLGWAGYAWRAQVVEAWPPSARVYAAFGVQPVPDRTQ